MVGQHEENVGDVGRQFIQLDLSQIEPHGRPGDMSEMPLPLYKLWSHRPGYGTFP